MQRTSSRLSTKGFITSDQSIRNTTVNTAPRPTRPVFLFLLLLLLLLLLFFFCLSLSLFFFSLSFFFFLLRSTDPHLTNLTVTGPSDCPQDPSQQKEAVIATRFARTIFHEAEVTLKLIVSNGFHLDLDPTVCFFACRAQELCV